MATIHEEPRSSRTAAHEPDRSVPVADADLLDDDFGRSGGNGRMPGGPHGGPTRRLVVGAALVLGLGALAFAAWPYLTGASGSQSDSAAAVHTASRERLQVQVVEDGNVESAQNVDVKCQVAGGSTILWIVEDGTYVEKDEVICRLDQAAIEDQLNSQKGVYETALATQIQANEDFEAAKIAVQEYEQGTYLKELQILEADITIAEENLRSSKNLLQHTELMVRKNFATSLQLEADQFAVRRSEIQLAAAKTARDVLVEFTKPKTLKTLQATRDAAEARLRAENANLALEKSKLDRLEQQFVNCVIKAPQGGMVVYANERSRFGSSQATVEEGASVRDRQTIMRIPDLTNMQVKVTVHESKVEQIAIGMPAAITIGDRPRMTGKVISIANQPESTNFFQAAVKEYATIVKIDGTTAGLKPGMTAAVEIEIADLRDVLTVPVSCVVELRRRFYAWVRTPGGPEQRPLVLGMTNDKLIEVKDGLKEGDEVYLNPRAYVPAARQESQTPEGAAGAAVDASPDAGASSDASDAGAAGGQRAASAGAAAGRPDASGDAGPGAGGGPRGAGEGGPGGERRGGRGSMDLMQFDKDSDGKVSRDEAPEQVQGFFDRMDSNSDGFIDAAEIAESRRRFQSGGGRGGEGGPGGGSRGAERPPGQ